MEILRIVDYKYKDESYLLKILKKHNANVIDWTKKGYGLLLDIKVPCNNLSDLKHDLIIDRNFDIDYN